MARHNQMRVHQSTTDNQTYTAKEKFIAHTCWAASYALRTLSLMASLRCRDSSWNKGTTVVMVTKRTWALHQWVRKSLKNTEKKNWKKTLQNRTSRNWTCKETAERPDIELTSFSFLRRWSSSNCCWMIRRCCASLASAAASTRFFSSSSSRFFLRFSSTCSWMARCGIDTRVITLLKVKHTSSLKLRIGLGILCWLGSSKW